MVKINELLKFRKRIDKIDSNIMKLLKMRFKIVRQMSKYKKKNNMPVQDRAREIQIVKKRMRRGLNKKFVSDFYKLLFKESRRIQR